MEIKIMEKYKGALVLTAFSLSFFAAMAATTLVQG